MPRVAVIAVFAIVGAFAARAGADIRLDALASRDAAVVRGAVAEVEGGAATVDQIYAAARASEDVLADPARALALYERVVREAPDARAAVAAGRRATDLRARIGGSATEAAQLAAAIASAGDPSPDANPSPASNANPSPAPHASPSPSPSPTSNANPTPDASPSPAPHANPSPPSDAALEATLDALAAKPWPGATDAALFHAAWLRRRGRFADALARYDAIAARWPDTAAARTAHRAAAGTALDARAWDDALARATALPAATAVDALERADLIAHAHRGKRIVWLYRAAWAALALVLAALAASVASARRAARIAFAALATPRRPRLRPPGELVFLAPIGAVLVGVAVTAHRLIAPAVATIVVGALALATLSGMALDQLRLARRPILARALLHAALALVAAAALLFVAVERDGLLEMLLETVRFGPDAQ